MAANEPEATGERGALISTASVAAYDANRPSGLSPPRAAWYMTLPIARDLARSGIRNMTIAPGILARPCCLECPRKCKTPWLPACPSPAAWPPARLRQAGAAHCGKRCYGRKSSALDGAIRTALK